MTREEQRAKAAHEYIQSDSVAAGNEVLAFGDFIDGAKWADSNPQWIPVEESLPKFDEQVLVYGLCPNGCRLFYVDCLIQDINDNGYPKWDDDTIIPTHWLPIVPPRKEANNERQ